MELLRCHLKLHFFKAQPSGTEARGTETQKRGGPDARHAGFERELLLLVCPAASGRGPRGLRGPESDAQAAGESGSRPGSGALALMGMPPCIPPAPWEIDPMLEEFSDGSPLVALWSGLCVNKCSDWAKIPRPCLHPLERSFPSGTVPSPSSEGLLRASAAAPVSAGWVR